MTKKTDNKKAKQKLSDERIQQFLRDFSRESPYIRSELAKSIPAYNMLLNAEADDWQSIALRLEAEKRGILFDKQNPPVPSCPHCGQYEKVGPKGTGNYYCSTCERKFRATSGSIVHGQKTDSLTYMKVLLSLMNFSSIAETCEMANISPETYYGIRERLAHGMQLVMNPLRLYGYVAVDICYVRASYKGLDLTEDDAMDFPEDSIFFDNRYKPLRSAKKRGGPNLMDDRTANSIAVFCGIDDRHHVFACMAGMGNPTVKALESFVGRKERFLPVVPKEDPFGELIKKRNSEPTSKPGDQTIIIADKEKSIERYANNLGLGFESHVYRADGVQRKLAKDARDIQTVNALHSRLKKYLRNSGYISSKYLPLILTMFCFRENCGDSPEAIKQLFEVLAMPGLGKPASFYENMYTVPNYLQQWMETGTKRSALQKIPYNRRLAFYLYDHIRNKEQYPDTNITMDYILKETGYKSAKSIRTLYHNLDQAGYRESILSYFGEPSGMNPLKDTKEKGKKERKKADASKTINPTVLSLYDEYSSEVSLPRSKRTHKTFQAFVDAKNAELGTQYTRTNLLMKFAYIEENGIRVPMQKYKTEFLHGYPMNDKAFTLLDEYENTVREALQRGQKPPSQLSICVTLGEKYGISPTTVEAYVSKARMYRNRNKNK